MRIASWTPATLALIGALSCAIACGDDDDDGGTTNGGSSSKAGSSNAGGEGGSSSKAGSGPTAGTAGTAIAEGGSGGGATEMTLCEKAGGGDPEAGATTIDAVVQTNVIGAIAADCRINTFFLSLTPAALKHTSECLSLQVQALAGCPDKSYPAGAEDSEGVACRSMVAAHSGPATDGITTADFDALIDDVVKGVHAGVDAVSVDLADELVSGLAPALTADTTKAAIIDEPDDTELSQGVCEGGAPGVGGAGGAGGGN
jgi:hypothetical protein